jgi:hypothetical protein
VIAITDADDRPAGAWCVGIEPQRPHWIQDGQVIREPRNSGPPLCTVCHRKHRDRLEDPS